MPPADALLIVSTATLLALALCGGIFAWSWKAWLDLQRHQLYRTSPGGDLPAVTNRIDLADLRERIRKLEAIAAGVDL